LTFVACALAPYAAQALSGYCHQCQLGFFVVIIKLACATSAVVVKPAGALMFCAWMLHVAMLHHSMPPYLQRRITFYVKCASQHATMSAKAHHLLCEMYITACHHICKCASTFYVKSTLAWLNACFKVQAGFGLAFCIAAIMCSVVGATTIATGACLS